MIDWLYQLDVKLFYFINHTLSNPVFDKFFPFITEVKHWYVAYFILLALCFIKGGRVGKIAAITVIILITVTDQFSSFFLKNLLARIRPCNVLPDVNLLVNCTESFSFPSSHAVNNFAAAVFFAKLFPKYKSVLYTTASLMALSRVIVGVHYPSDIVGGAIIGSAFGYLFSLVVIKIDKTLSQRKTKITTKYERVEFK